MKQEEKGILASENLILQNRWISTFWNSKKKCFLIESNFDLIIVVLLIYDKIDIIDIREYKY